MIPIYITGILLNKSCVRDETTSQQPNFIACVRNEHTFWLPLIIPISSVTGPNLNPEEMEDTALDLCSCLTDFTCIHR